MKKNRLIYSFLLALPLLALLVASSCTEDGDGSPEMKAGNPTFGTISPTEAKGGTVLVLKGSGLGDIRSIVFNNHDVPTGVLSTLNTESAIVFSVPDTAYGGEQKIVLTNSAGRKLEVPFSVIALPAVTKASLMTFTEDTEITLTGNNLDDVSEVKLEGTSETATILSQTRKNMVIKMPASEVNRASLVLTNASGVDTTGLEFINLDKAYRIFTDDYENGFGDGSWGAAGAISSDVYISGSKSVGKVYQKGNWHLINFANWWPGCADDGYTYLSFYVKGASADYSLYITGDKCDGGFGNYDEDNRIDVPANVWTFFKVPISKIGLWATGTPFNQLGFRIKGPDNQDETFYFDDVILVK